MAPITIRCTGEGCQYETPEAELELATQLLRIHADSVHVVPVGNVHQPVRPEKVRCPQLVVKEGFVTEEAFGYFEHAWKEYKTLAAVTTAVKHYLSSCLGEEVSTLLYAKFGAEGYDALTEAGLMEAAKGMVVKTRYRLVMQLQLKKIL